MKPLTKRILVGLSACILLVAILGGLYYAKVKKGLSFSPITLPLSAGGTSFDLSLELPRDWSAQEIAPQIPASSVFAVEAFRSIGYRFITGNVQSPSVSIKLRADNSSPLYTTSLSNFVKNTVTFEVGNLNYHHNALAAIAISAKMFAWWAHFGSYRDNLSADLQIGNDVTYAPSLTSYSSAITTAWTAATSQYILSHRGQFFSIRFIIKPNTIKNRVET